MVKRYRTDLFEALKNRHDRRQKLYQEKYDEVLPELMKKWESKKNGDRLAKRQAALQAEEYAAKHQNGGTEYPEEKVYTFKPAGKGKSINIRAKTYMAQLVHKLEGEYGDPNGFDLEHPRVSPDGQHMSSRGFNFPTVDTIREMLSEWLNYIGHHMLGELPDEDNNIHWRADHAGGSGKVRFDDTFTVNRVKNERFRYWYDRIPTEENVLKLWQQVLPDKKPGANSDQIRKNTSKREQLARALADHDVKKMVSDGKIRTPPTPHHPQGRVVELDNNGDIKHPSLYMPHKKATIHYVNDNGEDEPVKEELPYLLPGNFLRKLSPAESESLPDENKVGKHWNPDSQSFESQYIPVTDHPAPGAQGTDHIRAGALNPNNNTTGRKFLDPSDPEYDSRLEQLNHEIGLRPDGQSSEIYEAIEQALEASNTGGMGNHERKVLTLMKRDLHNLAYMLLMENLDESDDNIFSPEWRKRKIRDMVAKYGQQDWGRGTRRLRGSKETHELDAEVQTKDPDGDETPTTTTVADQLSQQLEKAKAQALALRDSGKCKVAPGEKRLRTGECQFEYDLRQLHSILDSANRDAVEADAEIKRGEAAIDGQTMGVGVQSKLDATFRAFSVLKAQYMNMGEQESAAEESAMKTLGEITHDDPAAEKIISRVRYRVDKLAKQAGADIEKAKVQPVDKTTGVVRDEEQIRQASTHLGQIEEMLQKLLDDGHIDQYLLRVDNPEFGKSIAELMEKYPPLKSRYERLTQQVASVKKQLATPVQKVTATPTSRAANRNDLMQMLRDNQLELIPFNTQFRRLVGEGRITHAKVKEMLDELKQRQGTLFAHEGDKDAIAAFKEILGEK